MTETTPFDLMPPKVAGAITKVMAGVPRLEKGETNTHGNYNFASIDDFLEAVRPLCAEAGLIILPNEESCEIKTGTDRNGKPTAWLLLRFSFVLAHQSGDTWTYRPQRTAMVNAAMGAQAFGAAQSYALKQFMRSLFQIATGEKGQDADEHAPADLPTSKSTPPLKQKVDESFWGGPLKKTEFKKAMMQFDTDLNACTDEGMLLALLNADETIRLHQQCQRDMPSWWYTQENSDRPGVSDRIDAKRYELQEREALREEPDVTMAG